MTRVLDRRSFVRRLPVVSGAAAGLLGAGACAGVPYVPARPSPTGLLVDAATLPVDGGAFVQARGMQRPIFLSRDGGAWVAVLASCTHRGCQPEPIDARLVCPCHGSEFAFDGSVLAGPADAPLTRYEVRENGGEIAIQMESPS